MQKKRPNMSDYVHTKTIMYPIDESVIDDIDTFIYNRKDQYKNFGVEVTDSGELKFYISVELYHTYGERSGDFGFSRQITADERAEYEKLFEEILNFADIKYDPEKLRYVEFCYYNCAEPPDYYLINQI